jgi:dUTP pyrophosphatase
MIEIKVQNDSKNDIPVYATPGSSGFDLRANVARTTVLPPGKRSIIPTGLHFDIPEGYELQVRSRSGLAAREGVFVLNGIGTVDSDFADEVCVILFNLGDNPFEIKPGDRIAQGVIMKVEKVDLVKVEEISRENDRGGGLGHTGIE